MQSQLTVIEKERLLALAKSIGIKNKPDILSAIGVAERDQPLPVSFAQQRLWFLAQMEGVSEAYHISWGVRLLGELDVAALSGALNRIVERHEVLRTVFVSPEGEPLQQIRTIEESRFLLRERDLHEHADATAELQRIVAEEAHEPFDLQQGPLIRGRLIRVAEREHALLLTMHHIVSDGWSMGVLMKELSALYEAFLHGEPDPLPEMPLQYADYAVWQRKWMEGEVLQRQAEYWKKQLDDASALLELPVDHRRPAEPDYAGATVGIVLDEDLTRELKELSRRHGTTLYMTLLAAWAALLGRLSGQNKVVIGTPVANRGRVEIEGLIGFFVNTLALRVDLGGSPTVEELLRRVHDVVVTGQQHQDIPFEQVVEIVRPVRSINHHPLFEVMFDWQNAREGRLHLANAELKPLRSASTVLAKFDFTLLLREEGSRIAGGLEFATALFERSTAERYVEYLRTLLRGMVACQHQPVSQLPLLTDSQREQVLHGWNRTAEEFSSDRCVHELFEQLAAETPDRVAVVFEGASLSYRELNRRANQLAHTLCKRGVGPETRVGICMERSLEMMVALLATMKAGGAYVPLDPDYPVERLRYMLEDSAPTVLLTEEHLYGRLLHAEVSVPLMDITAVGDFSNEADTNLDAASMGLLPEHPVYVIYTSGTTGKPKGVVNRHSSVVNRLEWMYRACGWQQQDAILQKTPISFDVSVWELFAPLLMGARVVVARPDGHKDPAYLGEAILREQITRMHFVPSMLTSFLEHGPVFELARQSALQDVVCSGEALTTEQVATLRELLPAVRLYNLYGPTEAAVDVTWRRCDDIDRGAVPIGRPIANTQMYVLDQARQAVPVSVSGELYIGGVGVARGYLNRADLTAERFVPDPYGEPGSRLYRTGDLGRWLPEGELEYLGRNDFQVKIRGFRIELGEIESRLREHSGVHEAVVIARENTLSDKRLVAYYTSREGGVGTNASVEPEELRSHVSKKLPEYMVPSAYVRLEQMPLTPNGKLDRKALPTPENHAHVMGRYEEPVGATESALAAVWAEVLKVERVGRLDNFFELGGHSLLAMKLIDRLRRQGFQVDVRKLFTAPTLAELAGVIDPQTYTRSVPLNGIPVGCETITPDMLPLIELSEDEITQIVAGVEGGATNLQDIYPLTPLQEGILFHHLVETAGDPYIKPEELSFESRARLDSYLEALQTVIDRHDILRTAIVWEGLREPVQVVWRKAILPVEEVELNPNDGDLAKQLYESYHPRKHRIDVRKAPMLRIVICEDKNNARWLMLKLMHHLAGDHTTFEVMQEEIELLLLGESEHLPVPLPFRSLMAHSSVEELSPEEHEWFFQDLLGDVEEPTAPFGLLNTQGDGSRIDQFVMPIEGELIRKIKESARKLGVSAASLYHVAWARVLARASGKDDVVFGTVLFGRMQGGEGAERVMGMFINTLPVRVRVRTETAEESTRGMHRLLAELLRHEKASLALAQRCSQVPAPQPLFSSLLNFRQQQLRVQDRPRKKNRAWEGIETLNGEERTNYPLTLSVNDLGRGGELVVQVERGIGAERVCEYMHQALRSLVEALESEPQRAIGTLEVLSQQEREQVLYGWNCTTEEFSSDRCVHELFEERAAETPDRVAVVFEASSLSYGELNRRANRLAHTLRNRGVGPEARVGVCMERSLEMIVALLATMKAGGAYVPLDPEYPVERLRYMLEDSAPTIVLTEEHLHERLLNAGVASSLLDITEAIAEAGDSNLDAASVGVLPEHLAYVIYTSGSTGSPKGVMVSHGNVARLLAATHPWFGFNSDDVWTFFHSYAFDFSVWEIWGCLSYAGRLVVVPRETTRSPEDFYQLLCSHQVTVLNQTPSAFGQLVAAQVQSQAQHQLRYVIFGGEALEVASLAPWYERVENQRTQLVNMYGITETTVHVTYRPLRRDEGDRRSPIGSRIPDLRTYILETAWGEPAPVGVSGELYVGGAGVARGYQNRAGLTAERFVPDPYGEPGSRLYRTGDLAKWRADGALEYLGRNDFQVKIRGFRIELGEIESRLREHSGVRDAVVIAREDTPGDTRLVAYYTSHAALLTEDLRAHMVEKLPEYMVPSAFVHLEQMPLTSNGKLDRKALPAPDTDAYVMKRYEEPVGETESALAAVWAEVLKIDQVGRLDNFFELGGHSLLAVRVIARLRRRLDVEVTIRDLFMHPVLADLARALQSARQAGHPSIGVAERDKPLPLSFAQERLWFLAQMERVSGAYHISWGVRLIGDLDSAALRDALNRIVERHEVLRTVFVSPEGEPLQQIRTMEESRFLLREHDLREDVDATAELRRIVAEEAHEPFDLQQGPLIRGRLIRVAEREYALLLTMHHIVSDGWSMGVLMKEFSTLYEAFLHDKPDPLPELTLQYADYAVWQRKWIEGELLQQQAEYWKNQLADAPALLELPADHRRPAQPDYAGATVGIVLDEDLTGELKELSRRHGTTLYMTLLAAWAALLGRLSGQDNVVIGSPVANRGRVEVEELIGFFVNTLALRVELGGTPTVEELLGRVRETVVAGQQHQDIPFEQVVEIVRPIRSLSHHPLFQVMFAWQNAGDGSRMRLAGLELKGLASSAEPAAKFDLMLSLSDAGGKISGSLQYATALFERATVERYVEYLRMLLRAIVAGDHQPVSQIPLLSQLEREQVLYEWNRTAEEYPNDLCVHELFEEQAARTPDRIAVVFEESSLSYGELNRRANQLAHALRNRSVGPECRVGICMERSLQMMVALLATMKAGGAYVPLDPEYPVERLRYTLYDSAPTVVLTQGHLHERLLSAGVIAPLMDITEAFFDSGSEAESNLDAASVGLLPEHPMYVIYTSGSTGVPKGVMIPHVSVGNFLHSMGRSPGIEADDILLGVTTFSFDIAALEFFLPLTRGAQLWLMPRDAVRDAEHLLRKLEQGVTMMQATPANWEALLEAGWQGGRGLRVLCGGEALSTDLARQLMQRGGTVSNLYGPTETTIWSLAEDLQEVGDRVPIGHPIANTQVYVIDPAWGEPAPVGVAGELYIGGAGVARGYLNRADLTAERFVPDPHGEPGARLYRTGDYVRRQVDGELEFLGRNDFQVKVRGFRIELGEIESRLREHSGVRDAVLVAREDTPGDKRLVAYYTSYGKVGEVGAEQLRSHLSEKLPEYMVPSAFVHLEQMPLTPNGKLDRKALPAPDSDAYARRRYEEPIGEIESAVAAVWADVLKIDQVGRLDNFFELGGHSLLGVRLISRLRMHLGLEVTIRDLFMHPVLAELARVVQNAGQAEQPPIGVAERDEPLLLSFAQERLWFLSQMEGASEAYHIPWGMRLLGDLDMAALRDALNRIVERHEVLRTVFVSPEGEPVQQIRTIEESPFLLREHDLREHADATADLQRIVTEEAHELFDLQQGPLIRGRLIRVAEHEYALLLTMHHIVSDGWSMGVLMKELSALYEAFLHDKPDPLPELTLQYADYAVWQRKWMEGELLQQQAEYWKNQLAGAPALLELPADHRRPAQPDYAGATVGIVLDEDLTGELKELSRRHGTTLYMTLLAAWAALLGRLSGQDNVVIGSPVANRGRVEVEELIGFFVNTLALRVELGGTPTVEELLGRVRETVVAGQQHQDIPFEQVVEIVRPIRSLSHHPLFQVMFAWQNAGDGSRMRLAGLELKGLASSAEPAAKFDLMLSLSDAGGKISGSLQYATALFERATVERYVEYLRMLLRAIVAGDHQPVSQIPLLSQLEREQVLYEWNRTAEEYPNDLCVHELFEEQAARTPDRIAVVFEESSLSYGELNRRANYLAHTLRNMGVGPESRVAICMERSLEMVVGLLATLKAGGAYVMLDITYPPERLKGMLKDCAPALLLRGMEQRSSSPKILAILGELAVELSHHIPIVEIGTDLPEPLLLKEQTWKSEVTAENLAYIIYTSGSTGEPKASLIPHRSIPGFVFGTDYTNFDEQTTLLQHSSVSWDVLTLELWPALLKGGKSILAREPVLTPHDIRECIQKGANNIWLTAALFSSIVTTDVECLAGLRDLMTGGETVSVAPVKNVKQRFPDLQLVNGYGPSECTVFCSCYVVPNQVEEDLMSIPIGKPIGDRSVYVLDGHMNPVPPGINGEIYIGGPSVARGYLNHAALTAERFVMDPFGREAGKCLYRTGDCGRWTSHGELEIQGRNDFQVKVRGFRIELGEIESRLRKYGGVRETVVVAREDAPGDKRLVAYYTCYGAVGPKELRSYASQTLPEYMVPSAYVRLEQMPLTPNGKLDRRKLPLPDTDAYVMRRYEEPTGEIEMALADVWARVLKIERVGRLDNFFDLGGTSLLAVKAATLLNHANASVLAAHIFMYPTIESLAKHMGAETEAVESNTAVCFRKGNIKPPLFVAPSGIGQLLYVPNLLPYLDPDVPVYGLPPVPFSESTSTTLEAMAARMVNMICKVQPEGPYRICGWSFGGILAYEIAAQLLGTDNEIEFLGLLDTYYAGGGTRRPTDAESESDDCKTLLARIEFYLSIGQRPPLSNEKLEEAMRYLRSNVTSLDIDEFASKCREFSLMPINYSHLTITQLHRTFSRERSHLMANLTYYAEQLPIPVYLFAAAGNKVSAHDTWRSVVPKHLLHVIETGGDHQSMMSSPHIESLGRAVSRVMRDAINDPKQQPKTNFTPLVPLQLGNENIAPLFCVPGAGANVTYFTELVACLDKSQPVYGLQPRGLEEDSVPHATVQAAAEYYLHALHQVSSAGPVHLLGHSFGGWIALQMAQELINKGQTVASLTILDTEAPHRNSQRLGEYSNTDIIMQWVDTFELVLGRPLGVQRHEIDNQPAAAQRKLLHDRLVAEGLLPSRTTPDMLQGPLRTFAASLRSHFIPTQAYPGPVRLVLVDDPKLDRMGNRQNQQRTITGWNFWAPHLLSMLAPGNHLTVLRQPHVQDLAVLVQRELSEYASEANTKVQPHIFVFGSGPMLDD